MMQPRPPASKRNDASASSVKFNASSDTNNNNNQSKYMSSTTASSTRKLGASSATLKKSERQSRREQRKIDEEAVVAATSAALLDSVVPSKLIDSSAQFVLSVAPRIFGFHTRHMTSIRHPFFTMLCSETPPDGDGDNHHHDNNSEMGDTNNNNNSNRNRRNNNNNSNSNTTGRVPRRGGTNNVSTAHVSAVDNALKAHRRSWQTLPEYLVERFSDISSGYPIETERWKQTAFMFDSVLLEDDLVRRRRDILESVHVVRALEACWTSWGGTAQSGIDYDTYKEEHLRLYQTLMGVDGLDRSFMIGVFDPTIEKDWCMDREVANSNSAVRKLQNATSFIATDSRDGASPSRNTNHSDDTNNNNNNNTKRRSSSRESGKKDSFLSMNNMSTRSLGGGEEKKFQIVYEVSFRKFCSSMLELADNWTRLRIGEQPSQVFAKFLMKVVLSPPVDPEKKRQEELMKAQQQQQQNNQVGVEKDPQAAFVAMIDRKNEEGEEGHNKDNNKTNRKNRDTKDNNNNTTNDDDQKSNASQTTTSNNSSSSKEALRQFATPITTSSIPPSMAYASVLLEKQKRQKAAAGKNPTSSANTLGGNFEVINISNNANNNSSRQQAQQQQQVMMAGEDGNNNEGGDFFVDDERDDKMMNVMMTRPDSVISMNTNDQGTEMEWKKICLSLKKRAFVHRGGPVIRMIPSEVPGAPVTYSALPKTADEKSDEDEDDYHQYNNNTSGVVEPM